MINITVVLVEGGMPSTAVAPVEIFDSAGKLWNIMRGEPARPYFTVRTASLGGAPVQTGGSLNLTPRTFARRFKLATGETLTNYLHRLRINAARHMLENDARGIHSISGAVGYDDTAFFRRVFKRHTGQSPGQYRQRFGINPPESVAINARTPHR